MTEYSLCEEQQLDKCGRVFFIDEDAVLTIKGNCVLHGQLLLGENCSEFIIRGDSLRLVSRRDGIGIGRKVIKNKDDTYSISDNPLRIKVECTCLTIDVPRRVQQIGIQGRKPTEIVTISKKCKHNILGKPLIDYRYTPVNNLLFVKPQCMAVGEAEVFNQRFATACSELAWSDDVKAFVQQLIEMSYSDVQEKFIDMCYAKLSICHTPSELESSIKEWYSICTYLLWAYRYYRGVDFDYSLIRISWVLAYKMEHLLMIEKPESLRYITVVDEFFINHIELKSFSSLYDILRTTEVPSNRSRIQVTNRGIKIVNAAIDKFHNIVKQEGRMNTLSLTVMGGNTYITPVVGETDNFCFACLCNSVYTRFMEYMDIPTNKYIEYERGDLDMVLNYLKYMSSNIPADAMREQLPELLRVSSQLLGFDDHADTNGINLIALWEEYVKHIDGTASDYIDVIHDYLHQVPAGSVTDDQIEKLYSSCVEKINSMINTYPQCTFLFTATYSKELAGMVDKDSSAYFVYMWQAITAIGQALLCVKNIDVGTIAPIDLFTKVNDMYSTDFSIDKRESSELEVVYKDAMTLGRSVKWGMWED